MIRVVVAALAGVLFGVGLLLSGMTDPGVVLAFLDVGGRWDPSLALVMVGAIGVHGAALLLARGRTRPLLDRQYHLPAQSRVDRRLVAGAALFGAGWGLAGFCPGPGLIAAATGASSALLFVVAMAAGMLAPDLVRPPRAI